MTGILPIKKYGSHSALNMFTEYSMTDPGELAEYFGFTEREVFGICEKYGMNFEEAKVWYDGYKLVVHRKEGEECYSMYSPKSVVEAMLRHKFGTYWNQTETYEALKIYIQMDMDGLKDSVIRIDVYKRQALQHFLRFGSGACAASGGGHAECRFRADRCGSCCMDEAVPE